MSGGWPGDVVMKRRIVFCLVTAVTLAALALFAAPAEEAGQGTETLFEEKGLELGECSVKYPVLREGAAAEELRETINDRILEDGHVRDYLTRVSQLISGGSLRVGWSGTVMGDVFSFVMSAEGAVVNPRPAFVWTAGNIDLRDGHEVTWEELFPDPDAARETVEAYLEEAVAPELSAHLLNSGLTPMPELFALNERGLLLLYPADQLSTLSDRAGDVLIPWRVMEALLDSRADGIPARIGAVQWLGLTAEGLPEENAEQIKAAAAEGRLPGIPVRLGDSVQAWTDRQHLLIDPDVYEGGRLFSLEGGIFRNVFLMTDFLSESWETSVVDGIRMDEGNLFGLVTGRTEQDAWRQLLGEPDHTVEYDEEKAEAYRTVPGSRDYYEFGGHRLQLHANEEGVLASVIISE